MLEVPQQPVLMASGRQTMPPGIAGGALAKRRRHPRSGDALTRGALAPPIGLPATPKPGTFHALSSLGRKADAPYQIRKARIRAERIELGVDFER